MVQLLEIIKHQLKLLFRNKKTFLSTIAIPIVLTLLFSSVTGSENKKTLYIVDNDKSAYSQQLISMLKNDNGLIVDMRDSEYINKIMEEQKSITALLIEKDFKNKLVSENGLGLKMLQNYESADNMMLEQKIISKVSVYRDIMNKSDYASGELGKEGVGDKDEILDKTINSILGYWGKTTNRLTDYQTIGKENADIDWTMQSSVGFLIFFLCFVVIQGVRTFIEEKENKTFSRLLGTPLNYYSFIVCKAIAIYIFALFQVAILLIIGKLVFNVSWFSDIPSISILVAVYLFAIICMGMLLVPFVKSQRQLNTISTLVIVISSMLGGTFFPIDIGPEIIQTISGVTPQRWAMMSLMDIVSNENTLGQQSEAVIILVGMGLVSLMVALVFIRKQLKAERGANV